VAKLRQMNVQFVSQEDRLILRVRMDDDSEIHAWLTRRYTRLLLGVLNKLLDQEQGKADPVPVQAAMKSFQRDAALIGADFGTVYDRSATQHPLGEAPVLLSSIKYQRIDRGMILLTLGLPDGKTIGFQLDSKLLHVLIRLLEEGSKSADWDLTAISYSELDALEKPTLRTFH